jgi:hypothetical protein
MTFLIVLPLISLASFVVLARYIAKMPTAALGAGFVMWIAWTGLCGRAFSATNSLHLLPLWLLAELVPPLVITVIFRKKLSETISSIRNDFHRITSSIITSTKSVWFIPVVLVAVIVLYSIGAVANIKLPQTMDDSVTAYLARAGFWISNHSTEYFKTSDYNFPLVSYPALPTFSTLRWIVVSGGDHAAVLDQWIATLISGSLVFSLARKAKISVPIALLGSLLWLLMPVTLLQSQMVLNDMVTMVAVLTSVVLASNLFSNFERVDFLVAVLAAFVAIGTKQTVIFMLPSALLVLAIGLVVDRKSEIIKKVAQPRSMIFGLGVTVVGLVIAIPEYLLNQRRFNHPLGPKESFGLFADVSVGLSDRISGIARNIARVFVAGLFGDVPRSLADQFPNFYEHVRQYYPEAGFEVSRISGVGWFGFTVTSIALIAIPAMLMVVLIKRRGLSVVLLSVGGVVYALCFMYTRSNFSEAFSRYMIFPVTLLFIVGMVFIDSLWTMRKGSVSRNLGQFAVMSLALMSILQGSWSFFGNGIRPLAGPHQVWTKSDNDIMYLSNGFLYGDASIRMIEKFNSCTQSTDTLGTYLPYKFPLSQLFGSSYDRKVQMMNFPVGAIINLDYLVANNLSALMVDEVIKPSVVFDFTGIWTQSYGPYILIIPAEKLDCH